MNLVERAVVVRRLVVLVAMMLVVGVVGSGAVSSAPAVGQATPESGLCDAGETVQFGDVGDADYGAAYILCMRALGLSQGIGDGDYGPDGELNRGQMASFLIRLWTDHLGEQCPSGVVVPFTDIGGNTHEANIECLFGLGITQGTSATTYGPGDPLTASQISRFLYRTYQKAGGNQCAGTDGSERDRAAECLVGLRVAPTTGEATSATPVTRAQMGVYVIGLWHNLTGRGLPPTPPQRGTSTPSTPTTTTRPTTQRIAYSTSSPYPGIWVEDADGANKQQLHDSGANLRWSSDGTRIAYGASDGLWVANVDGTDKQRLVEDGSYHKWSPDGTRIAYKTSDDELWVIGVDGTDKQQLGRIDSIFFLDSYHFVWSPNGSRIAYRTNDRSLWVADADGTNKQQLMYRNKGYRLLWSPDSAKVAYFTSDGELWIADADGTNQRQLGESAYSPRWSPDGTRIAYTSRSDRTSGQVMWVADADGTNKRQLGELFIGTSLRWSPDGTKIAYHKTGGAFWVMSADGTNKQQLHDDIHHNIAPWWSPDSTKIAYGQNELWIADADGTNQQQITEVAHTPRWSPDSTKIAYQAGDALWVVDADGTNKQPLTDPHPILRLCH